MTWTTRPRSDLAGLACIRAGDGPPVLLIHGVGLRAEAWGAVIDRLAERFAVHAIDLPGHGESPPPRTPGLAGYVAPAAAAAAALGAPARVAGHSMGAMVALDLALRRPALCLCAAALNAVFRRPPAAAAAVRARAAALPDDAPADPAETLARWFPDAPRSAAAQACRAWLLGADPAAYKAAYAVFASEDGPADAALAGLARPALFMTGAREPNSTPGMSLRMAARAPRAEALILDGAAHMMPMTHSAQVAAALTDFFDRCAAPAP